MRNRLTERDLSRIVRRVVNEEEENPMTTPSPMDEGKRINLELKQELELSKKAKKVGIKKENRTLLSLL